MLNDAQIAADLRTVLERIDVPPVPLARIHERCAAAPSLQRRRRIGRVTAAIAAAAVLVVALPLVAPGFAQSIEERIEAILRWKPPPPAPASVTSAMRAQTGSLAQAQARVDFTIVAPAGLPQDVFSEEIATTPTGVYSRTAHRWSVGGAAVSFTYRRRGGRSFTLLADRFDRREGPPSKYVFIDEGESNGHEVLQRRDAFAWRNGDQVMRATAGDALSAAEIVRIRAAMHGVPIPGVWPPQTRSIEKQYRLR